MSIDAIRIALETALAAVPSSPDTAWPGVDYAPTAGVAYQEANILFAEPEHGDTGQTYRQGGFLQVSLRYPAGQGPAAVEAQALRIRNAFPRKLALVHGGVRVQIERTPAIDVLPDDDGRLVRVVRVRFYANDLS